jgi:hypothetical protein
MLNDGSYVFEDIEFPSAYFNKGGSKIADSLIRMEIAKNIGKVNSFNYIFLTSDLTNALAASAENINSLYVLPMGPLLNDSTKQFENLLYQCAIYFGQCIFQRIKSDNSREVKKIEGIWSGKDISQWSNNIIRCSDIDKIA